MLALGGQLIEGTHLAAIDGTSISILTEGGLQHLDILASVALRYEVDGLGSPIGHQNSFLGYLVGFGQPRFQRGGTGLRIAAYHPHPFVQIGMQSA